MATNKWIGGATAAAQIWKGTVTDTTTGHTYTLPVTDENGASTTFSYTVLVGDTTVTILATSIATAWNASTDYRLTPVLASNVAGQLVLTARTTGIPFYIGTPAGTGAWTGTGVTTANSGANDWNTAANWFTAAVPATGDTVYLDDSATSDILYGLSQTGIDTVSMFAPMGLTKSFGSSGYSFKPGNNWVVDVGDSGNVGSPASGSPLFKINFGTNTFTLTARNSAAFSSMTGRAPIQITGGSSSSKLYVVGPARVDVAAGAGDTASLSVIGNSGGSSNVIVGSGCTLITGDCSAGTTIFNCGMTTLSTTSGASVTTQGSGAITTASIGGQANLNSTGTITTLNVYAKGVANFANNIASRTVTTANLYADGTIMLNPSTPSHVTLSTLNKLNGGTLKLTA